MESHPTKFKINTLFVLNINLYFHYSYDLQNCQTLSPNIPYMVFLIRCFVNNTCLQKVNYFNSPSCSNGDIALANGSKSQNGHVLLK